MIFVYGGKLNVHIPKAEKILRSGSMTDLEDLRRTASDKANRLHELAESGEGRLDESFENYLLIMELGELIGTIRTCDRNKKTNRSTLSPVCFLCLQKKKLVDGHIVSGSLMEKFGIVSGMRSDGETFSTVQSQFFQEKMFCQSCDGHIIGNGIENPVISRSLLLPLDGMPEERVGSVAETRSFSFNWDGNGDMPGDAYLLYRFAASTGLRVAHHCMYRTFDERKDLVQENDIFQAITALRRVTRGDSPGETEPFNVFFAVLSKDVMCPFSDGYAKGVLTVDYRVSRAEPIQAMLFTWVRIGRIWIVVSLNPAPDIVKCSLSLQGFTEVLPWRNFQLEKCRFVPEFVDSLIYSRSEPSLANMKPYQVDRARKAIEEMWNTSTVVAYLPNGYSYDRTLSEPISRLICPSSYNVCRCVPINEFSYDFNYFIEETATRNIVSYVCTRFVPHRVRSFFYVMEKNTVPPELSGNFDWTTDATAANV